MSKRFLHRIAPSFFVLLGVAVLLSVASLAPKRFSNAPSLAHAQSSNLGCLSGYAWSDNIGWIDFVCSNIIVQNDGTITGYAWANPSDDVDGTNNIGWISFNAADTASCGASAARVTGTSMSGWAKVLSADNNGWDGCISLSGSSPAYGVTLSSGSTNVSGSLDGYAWGSDVVGWISFNCDTGGSSQANICGTSNYAVTFTTAYIPPPYIASFLVSPTRVQKNKSEQVTFSWLVGGTVPSTCTISGPGVSLVVSPVSTVPGSTSPVPVTLSQDSLYTLTCGVATATVTIQLIPVVKEL